jgi:hypothetical protein
MSAPLNLSKPVLFALIGAITGLIISQVERYTQNTAVTMYLFGMVLLVVNFILVWKKQSLRFSVINFGAVAIVLGGLIGWNVSQSYDDSAYIAPLFILALIQIGIITTTFAQAWKNKTPHYVYSDLFENGWNNPFFFLFSCLFTGGFLLILALGTKLFDSIGINISDFIWHQQVIPIIVGALLAAGIGISREHEALIFKIRSIFFALFRVMAFLTAIIVILFAISLPFSWQGLFSNSITSIILLSLVAISILLLNTFIDEPDEDQITKSAVSQGVKRLFMVQILLLPVFSLLSIYAITLRIQQYGLMPNRIIALSIAIMLTLYGLSYAYQLLTYRRQWHQGFAVTNPALAILWLFVLITLSSPLLDPIRLSTNNQIERLKSNQVSVDNFDFYAIKRRLGVLGKNAIEEMKDWKTHPDYAKILQAINNDKSYTNKKHPLITILGTEPTNFQYLQDRYYSFRNCNKKSLCFAIMKDMNQDNKKEVLIVQIKERLVLIDVYEQGKKAQNGIWNQQQTLRIHNLSDNEKQQIIESLKQNKLQLIRPIYDDLQLGGIKIRTRLRY